MTAYEWAKKQILFSLREIENENVTQDLIKSLKTFVLGMADINYPGESINSEMLIRDVLANHSVWVQNSTQMHDDTDHVVWLPEKKSKLQWNFWRRYRDYLENERMLPRDVIIRMDNLTDNILGFLEDPHREGSWDRRGMVVGHVQSGKTGNYTGLICKAVDAGYKLVIVLTGMHNSLRSQTQLRLDEGFLGFDTQTSRNLEPGRSRKIGAGVIKDYGDLIVHSLTSSADNGDYNVRVARSVNFMLGGDPIILVVKKNATVLKNLLLWLKGDGETRENIPMLLVDDEADNASIDGNQAPRDENGKILDEDYEPTKINRLIRRVLNTFKQSAYIGYTATPFANIFIYPSADRRTDEYGEDLFPRSFIINMPAPSNYIGPGQVFGLDEDPESGTDGKDGLPIIRTVADHQESIPDKHRKYFEPEELPPSLGEAIKAFILSCSVRRLRGQENHHNSMLIHVTRFTAVQEIISDLVTIELGNIRRQLEFGNGFSQNSIYEAFKTLYEQDYLPTTQEIVGLVEDPMIVPFTWDQIEETLYEVTSKIIVKTINGTAGDVLDYHEHKNGLNVIAIGGDKLSRGLTLEGLTVSYYLRASRMYDTLMQMGRWFGYRPGYLDTCRLYTTSSLISWYRHIALANEELRKEFDYMAASGATPESFGLKVRTHPEGLQITAANKIRHGTRLQVSFANSLVETTAFYRDKDVTEKNLVSTNSWLSTLGEPTESKKNKVWHNVSCEAIVNFLRVYVVHPLSRKADPSLLEKYILNQEEKDELLEWTVALVSSQTGSRCKDIIHEVGMIKRADVAKKPMDEPYLLTKSHLISPRDEMIDLTELQKDKAFKNTKKAAQEKGKIKEPTSPSGHFIRQERSPVKALLLLYVLDPVFIKDPSPNLPVVGFAISFPATENAKAIEYMVDTTYWRQLYGEDEN